MLKRNSASYWIHDGSSQWLLSTVQHVLAAKWGRKICLCIKTWGFAACFWRIWGLCKVRLRLKEGLALKASESSHHKNHWSCSVHQNKETSSVPTPWAASTCSNMCDCCWLLRSHQFFSTGKSPPFTFKDIGFFSREFQRELLFYAKLTWLGTSKPFCSRNIGWWDFSLEQVGISQTNRLTYLLCGRMEALHLMSMRPLECWLATLNASSEIVSHALEQTNAARIGVICQSASSKLLTSCLQGYSVQFETCVPISLLHIHLAASLYLCPAPCSQEILFQQAGTARSNKLGFLQHIQRHIWSVGAWKYLTWCQ